MNKKIIAVDLDGTLFTDEKKVCDDNINAIENMIKMGHILAVDTGRPVFTLKDILKDYPVFFGENVYFLGFQGALGYDVAKSQVIFGHYMDNAKAIDIINKALKEKFSVVVFEYGKIYTFANTADVESYKSISMEEVIKISSTDELIGHKLTKVLLMDFENHERLQAFKDAHDNEIEGIFNSMFSHVAFLEYISVEASKGDGLKELASHLGIPMENTVAVGDERNDISMITMAGVGVAMVNGHDELKEVCDYITRLDNNQGGVSEVINKFIIDGR